MNNLSWETEESDQHIYISLRGDLCDPCELETLLAEFQGGTFEIDLEGIRRINSVGTRIWLRFIDQLEDRAAKVRFERCSVAVVHQLNLLDNFLGDGSIGSVMAPFLCEECNRYYDLPIILEKDVAAQLAIERKCPQCGEVMEFDDLEEYYMSLQPEQS